MPTTEIRAIFTILLCCMCLIQASSSHAQPPVNRGAIDGHVQDQVDGALEAQRLAQQFARSKAKAGAAEKSYQFWIVAAPLIGLAWMAILFIISRLISGKGLPNFGRLFKPSGETTAPTERKKTTALLGGKNSEEELGRAVFDALKLGNFNSYRLLYPTMNEVQNFFPPEKAKPYVDKVLNQEQLKNSFAEIKKLFESCPGSTYTGIKAQGETTIPGRPDSGKITGIRSCEIQLKNGEQQQSINVGSLIHLPAGWKIFQPGRR